jgi:hypothetical protein
LKYYQPLKDGWQLIPSAAPLFSNISSNSALSLSCTSNTSLATFTEMVFQVLVL